MCHKLRLGRVVTLFIGLLSFGDRITMAALSCDGYLNKGPIYKVVLLGEAGVGKTALFQRGKDNSFHGERTSRSTIGIDSCSKYVMVDDLEVTLSLWDTAGVERFRTLTQNYYHGAHAVMLVFSVDEQPSLQCLVHWACDADEFCPDAVKVIVANKTDLRSEVSLESVTQFADKYDCDCVFHVSAKTGDGVEQAFQQVTEKLVRMQKSGIARSKTGEFGRTVGLEEPMVKRWQSGCCS